MCGRYTLHHFPQQIIIKFGITAAFATPTARYNIAPTQSVPVVIGGDGARFLVSMQWGLIPSWAKEPAIGNKMINARAETLQENVSFDVALFRRRCLIPADGFYAWRTGAASRQPLHIRRKDGELFGFAGLWEEWTQPDGTPLRSCTIITTTPNVVMLPIHNRMPAILLPGDEAKWMDVRAYKPGDVMGLLRPYPADLMEAYLLDRHVNNPIREDPVLLNSL
jgi:putative SOS response-associated peptidase YedK